jgi:hypothetical protein
LNPTITREQGGGMDIGMEMTDGGAEYSTDGDTDDELVRQPERGNRAPRANEISADIKEL